MKHATIILSGNVQNVGLRFVIKGYADEYNIKGQVKNLKNGTVEIICEAEENQIVSMVQYIKNRDRPIIVKNVDIKYSDYTGKFESFEVVLRDSNQEMAEGFATGMMYMTELLNKQNQMLGKQDDMLNKQDETITEIKKVSANTELMLDKQDDMLNKQDETITEIKKISNVEILEKLENQDLKINNLSMADSRIESDTNKIKKKLEIES